jgi:hypothetical protein
MVVGRTQQDGRPRPKAVGELQIHEGACVARASSRVVEHGVERARGNGLAARPEAGLQLQRPGAGARERIARGVGIGVVGDARTHGTVIELRVVQAAVPVRREPGD